MADRTTDNHASLMAQIAVATAPLAQWLATGEVMDTTAHIAAQFAENAEDTRKKPGIKASFVRNQHMVTPTGKSADADNAPQQHHQQQRRRRHRQLKL